MTEVEAHIRDYIDQTVRLTVDQALSPIQERLDVGGKRMDRIEAALEKNNAMTSDVVDVLSAAKSGLRVIGWIGDALKWVVGVVASVGAAYVMFKGGFKP